MMQITCLDLSRKYIIFKNQEVRLKSKYMVNLMRKIFIALLGHILHK